MRDRSPGRNCRRVVKRKVERGQKKTKFDRHVDIHTDRQTGGHRTSGIAYELQKLANQRVEERLAEMAQRRQRAEAKDRMACLFTHSNQNIAKKTKHADRDTRKEGVENSKAVTGCREGHSNAESKRQSKYVRKEEERTRLLLTSSSA